MKLKHLYSILLVALPCLGHPCHAATLLDEQRDEPEAAAVIHTIQGAGQMKTRQLHSIEKLSSIEASVKQNADVIDGSQFGSLVRKEAKLLLSGQGILQEVHSLQGDVKEALSKSNPNVAAKLETLMERISDTQRGILMSEADTAYTSKLAAAIRNERVPAVAAGAFVQQSTQNQAGTRDPVRRMRLVQQALGQLKVAKSEVVEAYGSDDGTAQNVDAMMDQLQGSLEGLQEGADDDMKVNVKAEEADMFSNIEKEIQAERVKKPRKSALVQASSHSRKRFHQQSQRLTRLVQRTRWLAMEDRHIAKEATSVRRAVHETLGDTEVGEEVAALLTAAASEAKHAAASSRRLANVQNQQVHGLSDLTAMLVH